jgi:hypothetical protein
LFDREDFFDEFSSCSDGLVRPPQGSLKGLRSGPARASADKPFGSHADRYQGEPAGEDGRRLAPNRR